MDDIEFAKGMRFLENCLSKAIPTETWKAWYLILGELDFRQFERAIFEVVRNHKFSGLPPVGLFLQVAGVSGGVPDSDQAALMAWDKVLRAMREHGAYKSIQWDDPAIQPTINTIAESWPRLCDQTSEQLHTWTRKSFVDAYKAHRTHRTTTDGVSLGLIATDAGRIGCQRPAVARIGQEPESLYGFGGKDEVKAITGPAAELAKAMPRLSDMRKREEPNTEPEESAEEFQRRKADQMRRLAVKYASATDLV